ncbi:MAG: acyl-CoA oxidase, partial [Proteobacteria bacterium]|nr:acyl-CoA oxidase [Pseudomonadota bacterium]
GNNARRSLADLGAALSPEGADDDTQRALVELQEALGVTSAEAVDELLAVHGEPSKAPKSWRELEAAPSFDVDAMRALLDGKHAPTRDRVRDMLTAPVYAYDYELSKEDQREQVLGWLQLISDTGITRKAFPKALGESEDMGEFMALFETLAYFDISLVIKFGVQIGLFGGSIYFLGTKKHHDAYLADAASLALPGCFAMTELGHGSNVRGLETTATFDSETREWIIHTPTELGRKEWIGNAAAHARMATVFAQLVVDSESYGVHALLVPIRDADGGTLPGVFIDDCGHKLGLNGVDNGRLWFDSVRVPYDNLLDKYASVDEDGAYQSPIASEGKRFFTMLGTLVGGRVSIAAASLSASKSALTIATRYAAHRRQFGPSGKAEIPILDFLTHQRRIMPLIAKAYALNYGIRYLGERYLGKTEHDEREVEALAAGFKSYASWFAVDAIQTSRECCGGQGYLSVNRFANLKADTDIFTTFEGDN